MSNDELVIANIEENITILAALPPERITQHYVLPARFVERFRQSINEISSNQQSLVEFCQLFQMWFSKHFPPPEAHLLSICDYAEDRVINFYHNASSSISYLEVANIAGKILHTIPVEEFAKFISQPGAIDEIGDDLFGELEWQNFKSWMI